MNPTGIFERATKRARILLKDNIQSGAAVVSTITSYFYLVLRPIFSHFHEPSEIGFTKDDFIVVLVLLYF